MTSSSLGGDWSHLPSPTTSQPCKGKNLPSEKLGDEGTYTRIFGDITRLGSETQRNPYPGMKSRKWEKLPINESSEKGGILADVIADKLKTKNENKLNKVQGYAERTLSLLET
jgi:RNA recognition motif-containing protein